MHKIAVIGDIHHRMDYLNQVLSHICAVPDVTGILLVGDIGSSVLGYARFRTLRGDIKYLASMHEILEAVRETSEALGIDYAWVPGNHDLPDLSSVDFPRNCDMRVLEVNGLKVFGIGGAGPHKHGFTYEWSDEGKQSEYNKLRLTGQTKADILLCHPPPRESRLDRLKGTTVPLGSSAIRNILNDYSFMVCGHIHEGAGVEKIGNTLCLNAGALGPPHGEPQVGWVIRTTEKDEVIYENLTRKSTAYLTALRKN